MLRSAPSGTTAALSTALALMLVMLFPAAAVARRAAKPYYMQTYEVGRHVRGYEGFLFPDYYCSYKRYPKRVCSGKGSCRIVGWTLEQTCQ